MIATWMLYALALAAAVSAVALAAEYALRLYGRSTRWLWATSLGAALALPLLAWFLTTPPAPVPLGDIGAPVAVAAPSITVTPAAPVRVSPWQRVIGLERRFDGKLPWLWLGASVLAALGLALSYARLRGLRRRWSEGEVDGMPVLVSYGAGPAVVGLRRGRIVVPSWVLEEPEARRRLILAHEAEHLAAGDARLLTAALAALVAAPWNPLVWWQIRRLRLAAEVDCDARVLRRGADLRGYAGLLLDVGMRFGEGGALAAFAEPRSLLARRLRALTAPLPRRRGWRLAAVTVTGAGVAALACVAPRPDKPLPTEPIGPVQAVLADTSNPHDTPYTVAPELTNREEVRRLLVEAYPPLLKQAGIGGQILVWEHVDRTGQVISARIDQGSGQPPLDSAALYVGRQMKFTPARNGSAPVDIWIKLPIIFATDGMRNPANPADSAEARRLGMLPESIDRKLPPGVIAPDMTGEQQVAFFREVSAAYPPVLKAAGIGGRTWVRVHVDESGGVTAAPVVFGSGRGELDAAAAKAAFGMHFVPARDSATGKPVAVDIVLPVTFRAAPASTPKTPAPAPAAVAAAAQDTFDVPPKLINRDEVNAEMQRMMTPAIRAFTGPRPIVRLHVDESGQVTDLVVTTSSGSAEVDNAFVKLARLMRFSPALLQGKPVAAWIETGRPPARPTPEQIRRGPVFTPYTVAPEITNREDIRLALVREYPPDLKAAGTGGEVQIWLLLDASGTPLQVSVKKTSGLPALDSAAVRVGQMIRFTPARNDGQPVEVWIALPIIFKTTPSPAPAAPPKDTARTTQSQASPAPDRSRAALGALVASSWVAVMHR